MKKRYWEEKNLVLEGGKVVTYYQPWFVHDFGHGNYDDNPLNHEYKGSFTRHRAVERPLLFLKDKVLEDRVSDACPIHGLIDALLSIFFGLNCGFPQRDVALYTWWRLRGSPRPRRSLKR